MFTSYDKHEVFYKTYNKVRRYLVCFKQEIIELMIYNV